MSKRSEPNEIRITRVYDAPVKLVWDAWTDPKKAALWWGPRGFTITTHSKDLRVGGHWHYTMHGPDGTDYENNTIYHEVVERQKLVYDHGGNKDRPPLFRVTALFTELKGGKTEMDLRFRLPTAEEAEQTKKFIKAAGGNGTWDRLAEYLEESATKKDVFVISRSFEAPIARVFEVWTNPDHFSKWLPPAGFTMKFLKADIRPGGETFYSMTSEDGKTTMYGKARYIEISPVTRLVYTQVFSDEKGGISRHPHAPTWPETMLTTVTLAEEGPDETRVTITWEIHGEATAAEREMFHNAKPGMTQGWTGSFDKLEEYLARG